MYKNNKQLRKTNLKLKTFYLYLFIFWKEYKLQKGGKEEYFLNQRENGNKKRRILQSWYI